MTKETVFQTVFQTVAFISLIILPNVALFSIATGLVYDRPIMVVAGFVNAAASAVNCWIAFS